MPATKLLLPETLWKEIADAAIMYNRQPGEMLEEAVRKYLDELSWHAFVDKAENRNRANGISETDVSRLITEVRSENETSGR